MGLDPGSLSVAPGASRRVYAAVGAATPVAVILQLRNDLDPHDGIASVMDVAMAELQRTEGVLRQLDRVTDEFAEASEAIIARWLDRLLQPLKRLKDVRMREEP